MDVFLYRKELKKISGIIISNHFKNKLRYNYAKYKLFKRFSYIKYQDTIVSTPFFFPYFKQNYIFFCKNYPDIVGLVLYSLSDLTEAEIQHYVKSIIKNYSANVSDEYVLKIEKSYKGNRKKIQNIIDSSKIQKKEIMDTITLINIYRDKNFIVKAHYLLERLFQELIFSLQLLNHFVNHEDMDIPTINIIRTYPKLLKDLGKLDKISNSHHPIINMILEDLDKIYKRVEKLRIEKEKADTSKKQVKVSTKNPFSDLRIKMSPNLDDNFKNEVIINNDIVIEMNNSPFDLLYSLLWLRKYHKNTPAEIRADGSIDPDIIKEMTNNDSRIDRFGWTWNIHAKRSRLMNEKSKQVGKINEEFKKYTNLDKPIIIKNPSLYKLASEVRTENIEFDSFQKNS